MKYLLLSAILIALSACDIFNSNESITSEALLPSIDIKDTSESFSNLNGKWKNDYLIADFTDLDITFNFLSSDSSIQSDSIRFQGDYFRAFWDNGVEESFFAFVDNDTLYMQEGFGLFGNSPEFVGQKFSNMKKAHTDNFFTEYTQDGKSIVSNGDGEILKIYNYEIDEMGIYQWITIYEPGDSKDSGDSFILIQNGNDFFLWKRPPMVFSK